MKTETTHCTLQTTNTQNLYMAFELGWKHWKLGFTIGFGQRPRVRTIAARDLKALEREILLARSRFSLTEEQPVLSCYEAGRDGFWLHRYLETQNISNLVVDSSSIEVNRRYRRAKTDSLDVGKLLSMLMRYHQGEHKVWRVVNVPGVEEEDNRQLHRELSALKKERTRYINRIKGLLASQGVGMSVTKDFLEKLDKIRLWDGTPVPAMLRDRLEREYQLMQYVAQRIRELEAQRREILRTSDQACIEQVRHLMRLRGIGINSAWLFVMEFFAWRNFRNRKEIGALSGLTPTPYQSGDSRREQGISKAGNRYIRSIVIEIAWGWLYHQPDSQLSRWYHERFGHLSSRQRRIGIVALARKLLIALWRYLETGTLPEGAVLTPQ